MGAVNMLETDAVVLKTSTKPGGWKSVSDHTP